MPGTSSPSSPTVYHTRQKTDDLAIAQALLGPAASVLSSIRESTGHTGVKIIVRANPTSPGTVEVYQSIDNPSGGPTFVLTESKATAADPNTGEQVAFFTSKVFGKFTRIKYVNGAVQQTVFQMSSYLIPVGG